MEEKPPFNPNQPFKPVDDKPAFNPNQPFTPVKDTSTPISRLQESSVKVEVPTYRDPKDLQIESALNFIQENSARVMKDDEKEILRSMMKNPLTKQEELSDAIVTLQGKKVKQQDNTWFTPDYYMDKNEETGNYVPKALAYGEKAPRGKDVASIWNTRESAEDDTWYQDLGKTLFNAIPGAVGSVVDVLNVGTQLVTGEESETLTATKQATEALKFKKDTDLEKPLFNAEGIEKFSDIIDPNRFDFSPQAVWGTFNSALGSIGEFVATGGVGGTAIKAGKGLAMGLKGAEGAIELGKTAQRVAAGFGSYAVNLKEGLDAADEIGLQGRDRAKFALISNIPIAALDVAIGLDGKILSNTFKKSKAELLKEIGKGIEKDAAGNITEQGYKQLAKATATQYGELVKLAPKEIIKDAVGEGGQEAAQAFALNASKQLWDAMSDEDKAKFGVDAFSAKSFGEYVQNGLAGLIGGAPMAIVSTNVKQKHDEQSINVYNRVKEGPEAVAALRIDLANALQKGELTQQEYDNANYKINSYQKYENETKGMSLNDESKKRAFELSFQIEGLKTEIPTNENEISKLDPITRAKVESKQSQVKALQKELNETILKGEIKQEPVVGETIETKVKKEGEKIDAVETEKEEAVDTSAYTPEELELFNKYKIKPSAQPKAVTPKFSTTEIIEEAPTTREYKVSKVIENEKRGYAEIPNEQWNDPKFDVRVKQYKLAEELDKTEAKTSEGVLEQDADYIDRDGFRVDTFRVTLPDGKSVRFASSMFRRPDEKAAGGFRGNTYEENLTNRNNPIGQKVGVTVKKLKDSGRKVIFVWNAEPGKKYGKHLGMVKESLRGVSNYSQADLDEMADLRMTNMGTDPNMMAAKPEPTKPTPTKGGLKKELNVSKFEVLDYKEFEDNKYKPENQLKFNQGEYYEPVHLLMDSDLKLLVSHGRKFLKGEKSLTPIETIRVIEEKYGIKSYDAYDKAKQLAKKYRDKNVSKFVVLEIKNGKVVGLDDVTEAKETKPTEKEVKPTKQEIKEANRKQLLTLKRKIQGYNQLPFREKKTEFGVKLRSEINQEVNRLEASLEPLSKGKIRLIDKEGKRVVNDPVKRPKDVIEKEKLYKIKKEKALNATPVSVEHFVAIMVGRGAKFKEIITKEFVDVPSLYKNKEEGYDLSALYDEYTEQSRNMEYPQDVFESEFMDSVGQYLLDGGMAKAIERSIELYERDVNMGYTDAEIQRMEDYAKENNISQEFVEDAKEVADNVNEEELNEINKIIDKSEQNEETADKITGDFTKTEGRVSDETTRDEGKKGEEGKIDEEPGISDFEGDVPFQKVKEDVGEGEDAYKRWRGDNTEYSGADIQEVRTGEPVMLTVYHGTTNEFYEFDSSVKGNVEGHLGKINYFTSDRMDAQSNYLSEGADLTGRIDSRQERVEYILEEEYTDNNGNLILSKVKKDFGIKDKDIKKLYPSGVPKEIKPFELSRFIAENELKGKEERVLKLHVKLNNPVVLGKKSTWIEAIPEPKYESSMEDAANEIAEENDITPEEAMSDYDFDVRQRAIELSGAENIVQEALEKALDDNGYDSSKANEILGDFYDSEIDLNELEKSIRKADLYENYEGEMASSQVVADMFKNLGYDGIILNDVSTRFRNMGLSGSTSHIHVFDDYANQIKLADGTNKTFNPSTKDIRFQKKKRAANNEKVQKVVDKLKKVMPKIKVELNENLSDKEGNPVAGQWDAKTGTITINPFYADTDTPIHEYGHILIDAMGYNNKIIQAAINQLKSTDLWKETKIRYPELSEENLGKEVLAEAIGREGAGIFEKESDKSKFRTYLEYIFDWFKQKLGLDKNIAKSLAKQVISGRVSVKKDADTEAQFQKTKEEGEPKKKKPVMMYQSLYRKTVKLRNLEQEDREYSKAKEKSEDENLSEAQRETWKKVVSAIDRLRAKDKADYRSYVASMQEVNKLQNQDLGEFSVDELINIFTQARKLNKDASTALLRETMLRIATALRQERIKEIKAEHKDYIDSVADKKDLSAVEVKMKVLSHFTEAFPELQKFSVLFDEAVLNKTKESNDLKLEAEKLAKAVIKEKNKQLGLSDKFKGLFSSDSAKYFEYMENPNAVPVYDMQTGDLIGYRPGFWTIEEAKQKGFSEAQINYLRFMRDLVASYQKEMGKQDAQGNFENMDMEVLRVDKNFSEAFQTEGLVQAFSYYLGGGGSNLGAVRIAYNGQVMPFAEIEKDIIKKSEKGILEKAKALAQLLYYNYKARKQLKTGRNLDEETNPLQIKSDSQYGLDWQGNLTSKFSRPRSKDRGYSKDYYRAMMSFIDDVTHVKYMNPLIPVIDSIEYLNKHGWEEKGLREKLNTAEWIDEWKKMQIFREPKENDPIIDAALKTLRKLTSATTMLFNVPAQGMNAFIGNYNNWRAENGSVVLKGNKRLFFDAEKRKEVGKKGVINPYAADIIRKYNIVSLDLDSNPRVSATNVFEKLGSLGTRWGEYQLQGSLVLGLMTEEDYNSFEYRTDKYGVQKLMVKPGIDEKALDKRMTSYKNRVSDIQGKYAEKDRRNIMRGEFGKAIFQFKVWIPDWWKERFGEEYIDRNGKVRKGSFRSISSKGFTELRKQIKDNGFKEGFLNSNNPEAKAMRSNLKGLMVVTALLVLKYQDDEDEDKRKRADFGDKALSDLLFIFDPDNLIYTIKNPIAAVNTTENLIKAGKELVMLEEDSQGDLTGLKRLYKIVPAKKIIEIPEVIEKTVAKTERIVDKITR